MSRGKHSSMGDKEIDISFSEEKTKDIPKAVIIILAIVTVIVVAVFAVLITKQIKNNQNTNAPVSQEEGKDENSNMVTKVGNYKVLGKLVIKKIEVEQYILENTNEEALKLGLTKLYGPTINTTGNFCIAGHNYAEKFLDLNALEKDDTFYIEDTTGKKVTYKVYDKYPVQPDDLKCLMPNQKEKEVTLITCEQGAQTRLVVKAKETTEKTENTANNTTNNTTVNVTTTENKVTTENKAE